MKKLMFIALFMLMAVSVHAETVTIELTADQYSLLVQYAKANGVSVDDYIHDIVASWADSHIRGYYIEQVKKETAENLKQIFGTVKIQEGGVK